MIRSDQIRYDQIIWSDHVIRSYDQIIWSDPDQIWYDQIISDMIKADMIRHDQIWSDQIQILQASPWAKGSYERSKTSILTMSILFNERDIALQMFNSFLIFLLLGKSRTILKFIWHHHEIESHFSVLEFITPPCLSCLTWDIWRIKYKIHSWISGFWEVWLARDNGGNTSRSRCTR